MRSRLPSYADDFGKRRSHSSLTAHKQLPLSAPTDFSISAQGLSVHISLNNFILPQVLTHPPVPHPSPRRYAYLHHYCRSVSSKMFWLPELVSFYYSAGGEAQHGEEMGAWSELHWNQDPEEQSMGTSGKKTQENSPPSTAIPPPESTCPWNTHSLGDRGTFMGRKQSNLYRVVQVCTTKHENHRWASPAHRQGELVWLQSQRLSPN